MEVGKIISNNEAISGTRFFLGCDYYSHFFDESTNSILLLLRYRDNNSNDYTHTGYIAEFDLANEKMIWSRKVNKFSWIPGQGFCFINSKNMVYSVNRVNGTNLWSKEGNIVFKNDSALIIYSKALPSAPKSNSYYFEKGDNKVTILTSKQNIHYNVNMYADSLFLLTESKEISMISPNKGELWNYPIGETTTKIENKNYDPKYRIKSNDIKRSLIFTGVGTLLAGLTGGGYFLILFYTIDNTVTLNQACSNILPENDLLYFASRDSLFCIRNNGNKKWTVALDKQITTSSNLFTVDNNLIMLNLGFSFLGENIEPNGKPYIIITNKKNCLPFHKIDLESETIISDYVIKKNFLYLLVNNRLKCIDMDLSQIILDQVIDSINFKPPFSILKNSNELGILLKNNTIENSLNNNILIQGDSQIYLFDLKSNTIITTYQKEDITQRVTEFKNTLIWESYDYLIISDKLNNILVKLKKGSSYFIVGQYLYVFYDTYLQKTDLSLLNHRLNELKLIN
ncbi:MAG: hypothetical protein CVU05_15440 [Bacteroidetes bacterium HGW-Bacteroidetes-21]|nr:MAG: hypothetical protein CVU05_15440 [Bacteroidetes bacterium HGW-Bacteroidetes-21]